VSSFTKRQSPDVFDITPTEWTAILLSLRVAVVATLVATPIGIALAWLLARRNFWGKSFVDALVHLPLVLPPVVTGYLLLLTFGRRGPAGAWLADHLGIVFAFRWTGAALACGVMAFPLLVRPIRLSIEAVDRRLEQAAETLGAPPWRVFLNVTLPLSLPGVLAGMVLGFAKAIGAAVGRVNQRLSSVERVRHFAIAAEPFTIANGQMTPTMKIKRHIICETYEAVLDALYESKEIAA